MALEIDSWRYRVVVAALTEAGRVDAVHQEMC
jgi:hypothetical protein